MSATAAEEAEYIAALKKALDTKASTHDAPANMRYETPLSRSDTPVTIRLAC